MMQTLGRLDASSHTFLLLHSRLEVSLLLVFCLHGIAIDLRSHFLQAPLVIVLLVTVLIYQRFKDANEGHDCPSLRHRVEHLLWQHEVDEDVSDEVVGV